MKTQQLLEFEKKLSELNDRYAHYLFVWDQFNIQNKDLFDNRPDKLTTEMFPENNSSRQFNVKIDYLIESHEETQYFVLNSLFVLSYSFFEKYLIELHKFAKLLDDSILELNQKLNTESPDKDSEDQITIDKFINRLGVDIDEIADEEKSTLNYIRLRRNRIIHDSLSTQGMISKIISHQGKKLNQYWDKNLRKGRYKIDFALKEIAVFDKLEVFDLLNIIRKITSKIDTLVVNKLGEKVLLENIVKEFMQENSKKITNLKTERIQKKFSGYCKSHYAYSIDEEDLKEIVFKTV